MALDLKHALTCLADVTEGLAPLISESQESARAPPAIGTNYQAQRPILRTVSEAHDDPIFLAGNVHMRFENEILRQEVLGLGDD